MIHYERSRIAETLGHEAGLGMNLFTAFAFYLGVAIVVVGGLGWISDIIISRTIG